MQSHKVCTNEFIAPQMILQSRDVLGGKWHYQKTIQRVSVTLSPLRVKFRVMWSLVRRVVTADAVWCVTNELCFIPGQV